MNKAMLVASMFASCSFATPAIMPHIAADTIPGVWEAIDDNHLCVYQLEINPNMSGCLVIAQEFVSDVDIYKIYEIEIIPRETWTELIINLKNEERSVRLRGAGRASEDRGHLDLEFFVNPSDKPSVSELLFVKTMDGKSYVDRLHEQSLRARKARGEEIESNQELEPTVKTPVE